MQTKRIMVIEADNERYKQVNFLLRLAGYESRTVASVSEAVNWARVCHQAGEDALCLLVNSVSTPAECLDLLQPLAKFAFPLPVIMVRRDNWDGSVPMSRFPTLRILSCLPATLNAALSAVGQKTPHRGCANQQVSA